MRVTRNYRNGMVNPRKKAETASQIQTALNRSSLSSRATRLQNLLGSSKASKSDSIFNREFITSPQTTQKSQKFYYDMKYHADQVEAYGQALKKAEKDSVYDAARENGSTEEIVEKIKGFVTQYNQMLEDLKEAGTRTDTNFLNQLNSMSRLSERELSETGVSRAADGTLAIDEKKLLAADVDTLEKVWGANGFPSKAAAKAGSVAAVAEKNIEAEKSTTYNPFAQSNLYNYGSNVGSRFNSRR
ncbi:MAG: hypothetical protein NC302_13540 [Bacteroidales bacterium]|nr:hypothetical protein [Bacteroidales bacterium]MCM1417113.1 hypothetical protein [bacterium]MCM1424941.1 hypothetical protein [bacterium]